MATTDSKQETVLAEATARAAGLIGICFDYTFVSEEAEKNFSSVLRNKKIRRGTLRLEIAEVNSDGYIRAKIKFTDDMVVGNLDRSDRLKEEPVHTGERKPVQLQPPLVAANETEVNNTESVTLLVDNSHVLADENGPGETMINHSPVMPSDDNNPMSPLSNKSHMQYYSTRSRLSSSSVPTGPGKDEKKCFLSVMPFMNQKDLQKQFLKQTNLTCVLDYMVVYKDQKIVIFRNYTVLFRHVFEGLSYLKSQKIVHRDIKSSNILVHQTCGCQSPLQCMCAGSRGVTYLLGDTDLFQEESTDLTYTCDEWKKLAGGDPAGTIGMKPPESFFRTEKGAHVTTHKSDVWSACTTMMNVLIGKAVNREAREQFTSVLEQMKQQESNSGLVNNEMSELSTHLYNLNQFLGNAESCLLQSQSFQGGYCEMYKGENPLAGILTTAYGAQVLHWKSFNKLKDIIHNTPLWTVIEPTLDAIVTGIKFIPARREDAATILKALPSLDRFDSEQIIANNYSYKL